ncbi:MAG: ComEC family competence protein [Bacteroidia bacterium]|nr:ComEC family competence protein [Bacteroidia bacterium]
MSFFWNQAPFVRLIFPFIGGILSGIYFKQPLSFLFWVIIFLIVTFISAILFKKIASNFKLRWFQGIIINIILICLGYQLVISNTSLHDQKHFSNYLKDNSTLIATLTEPLKDNPKSYQTTVEVNQIYTNNQSTTTNGKCIVYFKKDSTSTSLHYGDVILIHANPSSLESPKNPDEFNYKRYLSFHNIYHRLYLKPGDWSDLKKNNGNIILQTAYRIRFYLLGILNQHLPDQDELAVASALLLGYKNDLSDDLTNAYASSGAMHVLAVSGLHVGIIYILLNLSLTFLDKRKYGTQIKTIILILALWLYALITGLSPSVFRAATMFSFIIVGSSLKKYTNIYNTLCVSAFVLLLYDPYLIMQVGFQLSYLAVLGIVYLYPKLYNQFTINNWLLDKIWSITAVSIAAQIATFPLGLLYFHQFPVYFLISNLIVIPAATFILYFGISLFIVSQIAVLSNVVGIMLLYIIKGLNYCIFLFEGFPYSKIYGISITILDTWFIYFLIIGLIVFITTKRPWALAVTFGLAILLTTGNLLDNFKSHHQKKIIFYSIPKTTAICFVHGKKSTLTSNASLLNDEQKLLFHVKHNLWTLGIDQLEKISLDSSNQSYQTSDIFFRNNFIQFCDKKILLLNDPNFLTSVEPIEVDYLILSNNIKFKIENLSKIIHFKQLIIDSSNSYWYAKKITNECKRLKITYADVTRNALIMNI